MNRLLALHSPPRPFAFGLMLTICYAVLSVASYLALDTTLDLLLQGNLAHLVDRIEWETAIPLLIVSSLLFLGVCVWLLRDLLYRTRALERAESQRLSAEQRALLGALSASVIHDSNNLLMVVRGNATLLERYTPALGLGGSVLLNRLERAVQRLSDLLGLFMKYAAAPERTLIHDLTTVTSECMALIRHHPSVRNCELNTEIGPVVPIQGSLVLIWSALTNLVLNAAEATGSCGRIEVRLLQAPPWTVLEVHDDGPGVPEAERDRIFTPFHTTKAKGNGLGLLSVVRCMEAHRGFAEVTRSASIDGACFRLHFPALTELSPPVPRAAEQALEA